MLCVLGIALRFKGKNHICKQTLGEQNYYKKKLSITFTTQTINCYSFNHCNSSYLGTAGVHLRLVAELDERHHHGQHQAPRQDVEDAGHVTECEGVGPMVLQGRQKKKRRERELIF